MFLGSWRTGIRDLCSLPWHACLGSHNTITGGNLLAEIRDPGFKSQLSHWLAVWSGTRHVCRGLVVMIKSISAWKALRAGLTQCLGRNGDSEGLRDLAKDTQEVAGSGFELGPGRPQRPRYDPVFCWPWALSEPSSPSGSGPHLPPYPFQRPLP